MTARAGFALAFAAVVLVACSPGPRGELGSGEVRHFARGDPFLVVGTTNPFVVMHTYLCTSCSLDEFAGLEPEPPLEKSRIWRLAARSAELRKLPTDAGFIGFTDAAGHHFQHDARTQAPALLGGARFPCGPAFLDRFCGAIVRLESDRTFFYAAGDTLRELTDGADRWLLYAVADDADLASLPLPEGWRYAARLLDADLTLDSHGFLDAYNDVRGNLWQKLAP